MQMKTIQFTQWYNLSWGLRTFRLCLGTFSNPSNLQALEPFKSQNTHSRDRIWAPSRGTYKNFLIGRGFIFGGGGTFVAHEILINTIEIAIESGAFVPSVVTAFCDELCEGQELTEIG